MQTRLDQFRIIPRIKDEGVAAPKATATDPEIVRLVGTITFPFQQASSDSILNNSQILQYPRVSNTEIDVFSLRRARHASCGSLSKDRSWT